MNSNAQDIVLSHWLRWSEALSEEGGIPTTDAALRMFCEHLEFMHPTVLGEMGGHAREQVRVWVTEDYLP